MSLSREEQETHVNFNRDDERATVYTSDSTMITNFNKLVGISESEWKVEEVARLNTGEIVGITYSCPVSFITFRSKRVAREYSDERRKKMAEALRRNINSKQKNVTIKNMPGAA